MFKLKQLTLPERTGPVTADYQGAGWQAFFADPQTQILTAIPYSARTIGSGR